MKTAGIDVSHKIAKYRQIIDAFFEQMGCF